MTTEKDIQSVSEAFSIQPAMWYVGNTYKTQKPLARIVRESVYDTGDPYDFYVGYDTEGNRVFQIRVQAATVQFGRP